MKIRFRGGPLHNKSTEMASMQHDMYFEKYVSPSYEDFRYDPYDGRRINEFKVKSIKHKYQLGIDERGKKVYFHVGCV